MTRSPTLLETAGRLLAAGPVHTLEVARTVLGLTGHPGAASRAVFTLLGTDPRFEVDGAGVWSLRSDADPPGPPLARFSYAVVDVETTGGTGGGDRVTEIAIVHVDNGIVGECFHTLVNPERRIPPRIQAFTGITDEMVSVAPTFEAVAPHVAARLSGRVFTAHNVRFDWGFVSRELVRARGEVPEVQRLCTVRLGRFLHPRLRSHGLDALAAHYRIRIDGRHRAFPDALATARLLLHLLVEAEDRGVRDLAAFEPGRRRSRRRGGERDER